MEPAVTLLTVRLNYTTVRYVKENEAYWFNARDIADAFGYASIKDSARKMKGQKYLHMNSRSGKQLYKVLSIDQVIQYAAKRSNTLVRRIVSDLNTNGIKHSATVLPPTPVVSVYQEPVSEKPRYVPERYLPSEDKEET